MQTLPIPEQDIRLLDPRNYTASGNLTWLLFDGGMRKGLREQALGAADAARPEITDSVVQPPERRLRPGLAAPPR